MTATAPASPGFKSVAPKLGFIGSFDGARGVGVCMVLVGHALHKYVESWVTIIDSFFVLSGFLIASLLLQEQRVTGTVDLKKFFIRRGMRLLPSVWVFCAVWLVIGAVGSILGVEGISFKEIGKDVLAALTYMYHVVFPNGLYTINPDMQNKRTMWHLWSLGVEEHFYFVIPFLIFFALKRNLIKAVGAMMTIGVVAIGVHRLMGYTGPFVSNGTPSGVRLAYLQRPDSLMMGVLLAIVNAHITPELGEKIRKPMTILGTICFVIWFSMLNLSSTLVRKLGGPFFDYLPHGPADSPHSEIVKHWYWFRFGHTVGAAVFCVVAFCLCRYKDWWLSKLWTWEPLMWMGRRSYTLYVWHALPYLLILVLTGGDDVSLAFELLRAPFLIGAAFLISIPMYKHVEMRAMNAKMKFISDPTAVDVRTRKEAGKQ